MIESIQMKKCATFDAVGVSMDHCGLVNFIYGENGTGKSTIGKFLADGNDPKFSSCSVSFKDAPETVLVYNREFRESQLKQHEGLKGVFTLGRSSIEDLKNVEDLKAKLARRIEEREHDEASLKNNTEERNDRREQFKDFLWGNIFKKYEKQFPDAFRGLQSSKNKLLEKVVERFRLDTPQEHDLSRLSERNKMILSAGNAEQLPLFPTLDGAQVQRIGAIIGHPIWQKVVVGSHDVPIGDHIKRCGSSDWVHEGRKFIDGNRCPFCQQQTITAEFLAELESFFNKEFESDVAQMAEFQQNYDAEHAGLNGFFDRIESLLNGAVGGSVDRDGFVKLKLALNVRLQRNAELIRNKVSEPSRKILLMPVEEELNEIRDWLLQANQKIQDHNQILLNLKKEKDELKNCLWQHFLWENREVISQYFSKNNNLGKAIDGLQKKIGQLNDDIRQDKIALVEAQKNITSVQPTIDEMNRTLSGFGFQGFRIVPSNVPNYYQIRRQDGSLVQSTLSEGEETFLTFLYFMQMCKGAVEEAAVNDKRIVVLDDPVCSLDSGVLYLVSLMIKDLIMKMQRKEGSVEQLFVLTHNIFFHKEISFFDARRKQEDIHYWILRKRDEISQLQSYGTKNPIKSSYQLLWDELKAENELSEITVQNVMRRILENYFALLGERWGDSILRHFEVAQERKICESLLSWVNDGSHSIPDDLYVSGNDQTEKYKKVFRRIFEVTDHIAHYNMMMGISETESEMPRTGALPSENAHIDP